MTVFEFIEWEAQQKGKYEFIDGRIVARGEPMTGSPSAMAGASPTHNRLVVHATSKIHTYLIGKKGHCETFNNDQAVYLHETGSYVYPDLSVACDPQFLKSGNQALENPVIVFEVLSPSTQGYDQDEKLTAYMNCPSLQQIVFIDSRRVSVSSFNRVGEGWMKTGPFRELTDVLPLPAIEHALTLQEIYEVVLAADPEFLHGPWRAEEAAAEYR